LFSIAITAVTAEADIDFEAIAGRPARFEVSAGTGRRRGWTGVCKELHQLAAEETGLSTYRLEIVPTLWLATQRRNHRMFQQLSELEIAEKLLAEWGVEPEKKITGRYKKRKYRVQYGETDFAFMSRMLEDCGITFAFETDDGETRLVLNDAPHANEPRAPLPYREKPMFARSDYVTEVRVGRRIRP